jgi:uncharacterized membrane protein YeaQ/YmgE (transglycosylase-associated protein family)
MLHIIGQLISGLFVGAIAQMLLLGNDPGGWSLIGFGFTALIGLGGALLGTLLGKMIWGNEKYAAGWIMSILGAILLLILFRVVF